MTRQLSSLVLTFADVSGVSPTVSAVTLSDVQPVYTSIFHWAQALPTGYRKRSPLSGATDNPLCICGDIQSSMSHIINDCSVRKFEAGLAALPILPESLIVAAPSSLHTLKKVIQQQEYKRDRKRTCYATNNIPTRPSMTE